MASLLVAAGLYTHGKIKDKREAKKEKKRKAYEARYNELEAEHKANEEKQLKRTSTLESKETDPVSGEKQSRNSSESQRSHRSLDGNTDGPEQWVEAALKKRHTSQSLGSP
jgi:protein subunit release factor B